MIPDKIIQLQKFNSQIKKFLESVENFEILTKKLKLNEIQRFSREYPNLLRLKQAEIKKTDEYEEKFTSILCITFIKRDNEIRNYAKLRKLKMYIDESNKEIIKILQN
ncbi:MAG: hypothetical protein ACFFAH_00800 [Promethearchaeota archaeon]